MKGKLAVFFAGFGAGVLVAFLAIGLAPDRPESQREVSRPKFIYNDTNAATAFKNAEVKWSKPD